MMRTTPVEDCRVMELFAQVQGRTGFLPDLLEFDSPNLTVYYIREHTCVAFFKDRKYVDAYIEELKALAQSEHFTVKIGTADCFAYPEWIKYRRIENAAQELAGAIREVQLHTFLSNNESVKEMPDEEFFAVLSKTYRMIAGEAAIYDFVPTAGDRNKSLREFELYVYAGKTSSQTVVDKIKMYVLRNYENPYMSFQDIGNFAGVPPKEVGKCFKDSTGVSLNDYINKIRITNACEIIVSNPTLAFETVAKQTGFNSDKYFHKIFKRYIGLTPNGYRKRKLGL